MWINSLFQTVLNMSLTASIVIVFVLFARLLLKKLPKVISYALWSAVLFRLLCPVSLTSSFSLLRAIDVPVTERGSIDYIPADIGYTNIPEIMLPVPGAGDLVNRILPGGDAAMSANPIQIYGFLAALIWLCGIVVLTVYSIFQYVKLHRRLIGAVLLRDNIYLTDYIDSAFILGLLRPKIYLPSILAKREREYILQHEKCHIRRGDHVVKIAAFAALCMHWFNPLVWLAFMLSGRDMEMSCDEAVMRKLGSEIRSDYAESLLRLSARHKRLAAPLSFGEGDTKSRIKNVLIYKKPAFWVVLTAMVLCVSAAIGLLTNPAAEEGDSTQGSLTGYIGTWQLQVDKTEENLKEYGSMQEMFGTGLSYGAEIVIEEEGAFHFYIGIGVGGDGQCQSDDNGLTVSVTPLEGKDGGALHYRLMLEESKDVEYLVMDYDGERLYWTKFDENSPNVETASPDAVSGMERFMEIPWSEVEERNLTFREETIRMAPEIQCIGEIPEAQIKLYGYGDEDIQGRGVAVQIERDVWYFDWFYISSRGLAPALYWKEEDRTLQVALKIYTGTGAAAEELHVLEQTSAGVLSEAVFTLTDYQELLQEKIGFHYDDEGHMLELVNLENGAVFKEIELPGVENGIEALELGYISTFVLGDRITFQVETGYVRRGGVIAEYDQMPVLAFDVTLERNAEGKAVFDIENPRVIEQMESTGQ